MTWKLQENAYHEWKELAADDYIQAQQNAFLDGFETAAKEAEEFNLLREWAAEERDEASRRYDERGDLDDLGRRMAFTEILEKLSAMGVRPPDDEG